MTKSNATKSVNLDHILNNFQVLKSCCDTGTGMMAVVKADAYGHGAVRVANILAPKVEWFAVNDIDEAVELRDAGIKNPILVFGPPSSDNASIYQQRDITASVSSLNHFEILANGTSYHLNFDTGMGRLGFLPDQVQGVKAKVSDYPSLNCTGIYSHFATADEQDATKMDLQHHIFEEIRDAFDHPMLTHMCNTAGLIQKKSAHYDLVRTGIGLYGYAPGQMDIPGLIPALSMKTTIIQVNRIEEGASVSYGATWKAPSDGYVGVISGGYEDGVPRRLSGNFNVMIEGKQYPVVGNVTMNYCMVWLGGEELPCGTEVTLLNKNITAQHWADAAGTIPYEILTGISPKLQWQK